MYSEDQVNHILFHNRSINLTKQFFPAFDPKEVLEQENKLIWCKKLFYDIEDNVEFESKDIDLNANDIIFNKEDLINLHDVVIDAHSNIKESDEYQYLINRGFNDRMINRHYLAPMSLIKSEEHLKIMGCTTHPILEKIFGDGLVGGGIIIPLFENDRLVNVAVRKIDDTNKMKYGLSIPDVNMWGLSKVNPNIPIWITEGLFDRIAMIENNMMNVISASTPSLSVIHLMSILEKNPFGINIWADKDRTGIRHAGIIQKFFSLNNVPCEVYVSEEDKDPYDHFIINGLTKNDIYPVKITRDYMESFPKMENKNFLEYLKNRKFK